MPAMSDAPLTCASVLKIDAWSPELSPPAPLPPLEIGTSPVLPPLPALPLRAMIHHNTSIAPSPIAPHFTHLPETLGSFMDGPTSDQATARASAASAAGRAGAD